jgi:uridine phosphorylase
MLVPGDPARVLEIGAHFDDYRIVGENRECLTIIGHYRGMEIGACSTGMGGPSTEIAVVELMHLGVKNLIRVGTSGGLDPTVRPGDLIIATGCVRYTGAADAYVPQNYPAVAHHELLMALIEACETLRFRYHVGLGLTVDTFYATKPHLIRSETPVHTQSEHLINQWAEAGVLQVEMETATLFVLGTLLGLRTAAVCTAGSNVALKLRPPEPPSNSPAITAACNAALTLKEWDRLAESAGGRFRPSLLAEKRKDAEDD